MTPKNPVHAFRGNYKIVKNCNLADLLHIRSHACDHMIAKTFQNTDICNCKFSVEISSRLYKIVKSCRPPRLD